MQKVKNLFDTYSSVYEQKAFKESLGLRYLSWIEKTFISSELPIKSIATLDIGTGTGRNIEIITKRSFAVLGIDISRSMLIKAKEKKTCNTVLVLSDGRNLPFVSEAFDCVLCIRVLKYIPEWRKVIEEISRVLKPNGKVILTFPNILSVQYLSSLFESYSCFRKNEILSVLQEYGFNKVKIETGTVLPFPLYRKIDGETSLRIIVELERIFQRILPDILLKRTILVSCIKSNNK
ncbi:MAG: class I SAM-dependent methyltransferase [Candidatus Bathyarchaeia archaeon]